MYKLVVQDRCSCFSKHNLEGTFSFSSKDEALKKAIELKNYMNHSFCKKHKFQVEEMFNNFIIKFFNDKPLNSCCGNGCCM